MASFELYLRVKPLDVNNVDDRMNEDMFTVDDTSITTRHINQRNDTVLSRYKFKKVFKPSTTQSQLFSAIVRPKLYDFFNGSNCLLFTYGTSNSGKTHSMQGTPSDPGIIPRVLRSIFQSLQNCLDTDGFLIPYLSCQAAFVKPDVIKRCDDDKKILIDKLNDDSGVTTSQIDVLNDSPFIDPNFNEGVVCSVWISFYEIYNEHVFDLLASNEKNQEQLKVKYDKEDDSFFPTKLKEVRAETWQEAYNLYRYGKRNLQFAETLLNRNSSRSHCVFTVKLLVRPKDDLDKYIDVKKFILCDLAGSERFKHHKNELGTNAVKEMLNINTSILALNKCFVLLKNNSSKSTKETAIPYRESKLTMFFKEFFKGRGNLTMVASISQEIELLHETEQVLRMTSVAHDTRIELKKSDTVDKCRRRFSTMMATNLPGPTPHQNVQEGEIKMLKEQNEKLIQEIQNKDSEIQKKDLEIQKKDSELNELRENLRSTMRRLENSFDHDYQRSVIIQMHDKYRQRVAEAHEMERGLRERLKGLRTKMDDMVLKLTEAFGIEDTPGPMATVDHVIYIHNNMKEAAAEEINDLNSVVERLEKEVSDLRAKLQDKDDELELNEMITSPHNLIYDGDEEEESDDASPGYWPLSTKAVRKKKNVDEEESDDASPGYWPSTTKKAVRKKKGVDEVPTYVVARKSMKPARRQLLKLESDYLQDHVPLNETPEDPHVPPEALVNSTLRSGKVRK